MSVIDIQAAVNLTHQFPITTLFVKKVQLVPIVLRNVAFAMLHVYYTVYMVAAKNVD